MTAETARRAKAHLRRRVRERLASLDPAVRASRGAAALGRLLALPEVERASGVLLFRSLDDEIDTTAAFERLLALGKAVYAPRVTPSGLDFARVRAGTAWIAGPSPAAEPDSDESWSPTAGSAVAIVPGVAFTSGGDRLGRGGGHYDRFLAFAAGARLVAVGVALEEQILDDLPREAHDAPVDVVVTDRRTLRRTSGAA